ncbi:membrane-associated protein, putative [Bodo saltans]|uniref:Membrane-associated protein, putative n=1 Tax=Bodo saltans TaxID=75058 RepID=A0A0S4ISR9_BODSA|nr:membrane-associated protein, putative [Bodo saltans]|eukprot:CUF58424.1 membrane-associated protein, putative [Bodo saltans]
MSAALFANFEHASRKGPSKAKLWKKHQTLVLSFELIGGGTKTRCFLTFYLFIFLTLRTSLLSRVVFVAVLLNRCATYSLELSCSFPVLCFFFFFDSQCDVISFTVMSALSKAYCITCALCNVHITSSFFFKKSCETLLKRKKKHDAFDPFALISLCTFIQIL